MLLMKTVSWLRDDGFKSDYGFSESVIMVIAIQRCHKTGVRLGFTGRQYSIMLKHSKLCFVGLRGNRVCLFACMCVHVCVSVCDAPSVVTRRQHTHMHC